MAKTVEMYQTESGEVPFKSWMKSLTDDDTRKRLYKRINKLRTGLLGDWKSAGSGVTELREDFGPGFRIYCGQIGQSFVILLCGGDKGTQSSDIKRASEYLEDYKRRTRKTNKPDKKKG
ncbi:MAG: type II toxin-antitoxin system RelE/ParE family toxin [Blastocatellia bacterium]